MNDNFDKFPEKVFITPIDRILKIISGELKNPKEKKFYLWQGIDGILSGKRIFAVNCGSGALAGDCVLFLKKGEAKEIMFFGFAGSVNKNFLPGDICSMKGYSGGGNFIEFIRNPDEVLKVEKINPAPKYSCWTPIQKNFKNAKVYTIPSLFKEREIFDILEKRCFDIIDMETAYIAAAGKGIKLRFFYYITDYRLKFKKINYGKIKNLCLKLV